MSRRWIKAKKAEHYYKKAKKEGYRSRATYKLMELNEKFGLIRSGDKVLDLGAAPGGWMQAAREMVGSEGFVLGVDLQEIADFHLSNVRSIKGDFTKKEVLGEIKLILPRADVVISDASPDISGIWDVDHFRSVELCRTVLRIAGEILKPRGNFLVKIFQGEEVENFFSEVKGKFIYAKRTKPKASRGSSAEIYIIGKEFIYLQPEQ